MDYQPLNVSRQDIRLVTIIPIPNVSENVTDLQSQQDGAPTNTIRCRLEPFSLEGRRPSPALTGNLPDKPHSQLNWDESHESSAEGEHPQWGYPWGDYLALSYAWGNLTEKRDIIVNGYLIAVGANLEAALRVLRDKRPIRAGYKIWIDALCINQQDIEERGREVKRMRQIYKQAHDVVVWLGNEENESNKALGLIRALSNSYRTGQDRALGIGLRREPGLLGRGSWRALSQLLDRPYWDRLWVLQEIALGGNHTSVLCGHQVVTWEELYNATYLFGLHNFDIMFSLIDQERKDAGLSASGLKRNKLIHLKEEQLVQAGQADAHIMCMSDLSRKSLATDLRDKIYGLLGMMDASVTDLIIPDYKSSLPQVYTAFAKAMIVASMSILFPKSSRE